VQLTVTAVLAAQSSRYSITFTDQPRYSTALTGG
jgi:hypothetical protein